MDVDKHLGLTEDDILTDDLKAMIVDADADRPRSQQRALGPSQIGHPCDLHLGFALFRANPNRPEFEPESKAARTIDGENRSSDPLAAIMGTAMHDWLDSAAQAANKRLGRTRWFTELILDINGDLSGSCDLYDLDTKSVLDWKIPGVTAYNEYLKHGPSDTYRTQFHAYALGFERLGFEVRYAGNILLCRTGTLRKMHVHREPYSKELAVHALERLDRIDLETRTNGPTNLTATPGDYCRFCPWWSPDPKGPFQCKGNA